MNRGETRYSEYLAGLKLAGEIAEFWFEPFSLRISSCDSGQPARYTPDFLVLMPDGRTYVDDVKTASGFDDHAAIVRLKVAATQFSLWTFRTVRPTKGGGFTITEI